MMFDEHALVNAIHLDEQEEAEYAELEINLSSKEPAVEMTVVNEQDESEYEDSDLEQDLSAALELLGEGEGLMFLFGSPEVMHALGPQGRAEVIKWETAVGQFLAQWENKE